MSNFPSWVKNSTIFNLPLHSWLQFVFKHIDLMANLHLKLSFTNFCYAATIL